MMMLILTCVAALAAVTIYWLIAPLPPTTGRDDNATVGARASARLRRFCNAVWAVLVSMSS